MQDIHSIKHRIALTIQQCITANTFTLLTTRKQDIDDAIQHCIDNDDDSPMYYKHQPIDIITLQYVSDRFMCSGRLRWLKHCIELVEQNCLH